MNAHALSGFSVKVNTRNQTRCVQRQNMVSSQYTRGLSRESMKCHYVRPQLTSFDAILWTPLLLQEKVFLFSVRQCNKLYRKLVYVFFSESFRWQKNWGCRRLLVLRIEAIRSSLTCGHEDDLKKKKKTFSIYPSLCYFSDRISTCDYKYVRCDACLQS